MLNNFAIERKDLGTAYLYRICKNNKQVYVHGIFCALGFLLLSNKYYGHVIGKFFSTE